MLLVIDVGNTNTVLGIFRGDRLVENWRLATRAGTTADEYGTQIKSLLSFSRLAPEEIGGIIISSVFPPSLDSLQGMCKKYFARDPIVVGPGVKTGMPILYDNPREVGADRIVNAVAAYEKYKGALVLVDFGTATTIDCVSARGEYLGGAIAPGLQISVDALYRSASKLYRVELAKPPSVIGKNTAHSMQAGIFYGYIGLVDELVARIKKELRDSAKVIATGGLANLIAPESRTIEIVDEFLTLEGLRIVYERNART